MHQDDILWPDHAEETDDISAVQLQPRELWQRIRELGLVSQDQQSIIEKQAFLLNRVRKSYISRALTAMGIWNWLDEPGFRLVPTSHSEHLSGRKKRVVADLTQMLPGGENGGAKTMVLELIRHWRAAEDWEFLLFTSPSTHDELAMLDNSNVRRLCHDGPPQTDPGLAADLLFCPFSSSVFFHASVPVVSVVYDLQYARYPEFFEEQERAERERKFRWTCAVSSRIICISKYGRNAVLQRGFVDPERLKVIHIPQLRELAVQSDGALVERLLLKPNCYLLYPANFWRHKNHEGLLSAFKLYRRSNPHSDLKLVLTGAPSPRSEELREGIQGTDLENFVVFAGFLPDHDFAALLDGCLALIFPSLYEGFGMPVLEAMSAGKPVLCSNLTSLPEVAGNAALYFDPREPGEIAKVIDTLERDAALQRDLVNKGRLRVSHFGQPINMASQYLSVFQEALSEQKPHLPGVPKPDRAISR